MLEDKQLLNDFEEWANQFPDIPNVVTALKAWQACQQKNDKVIAAKDAEIERLREALDEPTDYEIDLSKLGTGKRF